MVESHGIELNAAWVRAEIDEAGFAYSEEQIEAVADASDEEIESWIVELVSDSFWTEADALRSRVIERLAEGPAVVTLPDVEQVRQARQIQHEPEWEDPPPSTYHG